MSLTKKMITNSLMLGLFLVSTLMLSGCSEDATSVPSLKPVNNYLVSVIDDAVFANACNIGDIQIDTEAVPPNTLVDVEFVPGFNSVGACILDSTVVVDSNGRAFLDFIADYIVGIGSTSSFRILLSATTPDGQVISQFADINLRGIGIIPPTDDEDSSVFSFDIVVDEMGVPEELPFLLLQFGTQGIKPGTEVEFTLSNPLLGDVDVNPAIVSGSTSSGSFATTYFTNPEAGTNFLTATITLDTPQEILDECDEVRSSVEISVIVTFVQSIMVSGGDDGM